MDCSELKVWRFEIVSNNTGEISIVDALLDSEPRAQERATSEFIKNGYANNHFSWQTYRNDLEFNDIVNIEGLPYLIKGESNEYDKVKGVTTYLVKRYD